MGGFLHFHYTPETFTEDGRSESGILEYWIKWSEEKL